MSTPLVLIASHRGGSMKTSLTLALSQYLSLGGRHVSVLDPATAGGAASFLGEPVAAGVGHGFRASLAGKSSSISLAHQPGCLGSSDQFEASLDSLRSERANLAILDSHALGRSELDLAARHATVVVAMVPAGVISFRTLPPFLETLREMRAQPGRTFSTVAVLAGVGGARGKEAQLERHALRQLAPIASPGVFAYDEEWRAAISAGTLPPSRDQKSFMATNIRMIADDILAKCGKAGG